MTNRERAETVASQYAESVGVLLHPAILERAITRAFDEATAEAQDDELGAILTILLSQESVYFDSNALPIDVLHRLQELVRLRRDAIRAENG